MNSPIKISAISYLNTVPFVYGIQNSGLISSEISVSFDIPSACATKLLSGEVDLGIVPVAILPKLSFAQIVGDFCIGANGNVRTVLLVSDVELSEIEEVLLDYQSRTSVELVQILAREYWHISPRWIPATENYETKIGGRTAGVIIGDRTINLPKPFRYIYDLSGEWKKFTNLPFVFACWIANRPLPETFLLKFNSALQFGINNIDKILEKYSHLNNATFNVSDYFRQNIDFVLDGKKREAIDLFLKYKQMG